MDHKAREIFCTYDGNFVSKKSDSLQSLVLGPGTYLSASLLESLSESLSESLATQSYKWRLKDLKKPTECGLPQFPGRRNFRSARKSVGKR